MSINKKIIWSFVSIIVLGGLINATIIIVAYFYGSSLFWLLLITMPLLVVGIYNMKQTNQIIDGCRIISLKEVEKQIKNQWFSRLINSDKHPETDLKVLIGNDQCSQPYSRCILSIETINSIRPGKSLIPITINRNSKNSKKSCEEMLHTYYLTGDDLVWQIDSGFIGCRSENGNFNTKLFKEIASRPEIKMIELIISSATPSSYSFDSSLSVGISTNVKKNDRANTGSSCAAFLEPEGMIHFLNSLRELSGGKPIGIRLCINGKKEFHQICYAIRKAHIIPDFITVEGSYEGIKSVHAVKGIHSGMDLYDALLFVSQTLQIYGLEKEIRIIASGKIISGFDILKVLVLGANAICIEIPDYRKLSTVYKVRNVNDFHRKLMNETAQAMRVCGFMNVSDISLLKFFRNLDVLYSGSFAEPNHSVLYSGDIKKIYDSKIRLYQAQKERKKENVV